MTRILKLGALLCAMALLASDGRVASAGSVKNDVYQTSVTVTCPDTGTTTNGTAKTGLASFASFEAVWATLGNTTSTADLYLQASRDGGTTWHDIGHPAQVAGGAAAAILRSTATRSSNSSGFTTTGAAVLAANTWLGGNWGDRLRLSCVSGGAGTGVAQTVYLTFSY